jgi:phosphoglycerol transferase MdoB-like AlkP superfamily enzyme
MTKKLYINLFRILTVILAGLALFRPIIEFAMLPSVINLPKDDYAAVQEVNQSLAWLDLIRLASFISIIVLLFFEREHNRVFWPIRGAFLAQLLIVVLYVAFTLPINITTFNWRFLPDSNWSWLRTQWEYSRALSTIVGAISFVLLLLDLVWAKWR